MRIYKIAQNSRLTSSPDFIGYHCSKVSTPNFIISKDYSDDYFQEILDYINNNLRMKAYEQNLMEKPERYSEEYDRWEKEVYSFLLDNGIRWVFVSRDQPFGPERRGIGAVYGNNCFYVFMNKADYIATFNDINEINSDVYLFYKNKPPRLIPITEND